MSRERPSFSVCIPNYNHGRFIEATVRSALAQTYENFEVVVVDNASTDESVSIVEAIGSDRLRLFRNRWNVGFAPNLDRASSRASKEYVIVLSSDDLMEPEALSIYADVIERLGETATNAIIGSAVTLIDGSGAVFGEAGRDILGREFESRRIRSPEVDGVAAVFGGRNVFRDFFLRRAVPLPFCSTCYSRALWEEVGGYGSVNLIGPDAHFAYKAMLADARVVFVDRPLFRYRVHSGGQLAQTAGAARLRVPVDRYLEYLQFSDPDLAKGGVRRDELAFRIVDEECLNEGAGLLANGMPGQALRLLSFGLAAFPGHALRNPKSYALALACGVWPIGVPLARMVRGARRQRRGIVKGAPR